MTRVSQFPSRRKDLEMLRPRPALVLFLLVASAGLSAALLREPPRTEPDDSVEIAPGVYFRHGDLDAKSHCNNGFIVLEDFVIMVDANFPSGARACLEDIRKVTDKPVRFVFDTHHHGDHAYGNAECAKAGAVPVSSEKALGEFARYEPKRWREAAEQRDDVRASGDEPMRPVITYPERMVFDDGKRRVELLHFGTAHTRGDGFAYLPKDKVLFTGDTVVNGPYNYMGDGDTASWLKVIDRLLELDVEIVAPGHGPCGGRELIENQRKYIATLREQVKKGVDAGQSVDEIRESVRIPEALSNWVGKMFPDQVAKIYAEMRADR